MISELLQLVAWSGAAFSLSQPHVPCPGTYLLLPFIATFPFVMIAYHLLSLFISNSFQKKFNIFGFIEVFIYLMAFAWGIITLIYFLMLDNCDIQATFAQQFTFWFAIADITFIGSIITIFIGGTMMAVAHPNHKLNFLKHLENEFKRIR